MSSGQDQPGYNKLYTNEAANVAAGSDHASEPVRAEQLMFKDTGGFFDLLAASDFSLCVTREYEHFVLALDGVGGGAHQSIFPLPHPSGFWFDAAKRQFIFSSTRTPNMLIWMDAYEPSAAGDELLSDDMRGVDREGTLFLPTQARYLPGSLYIHDVVKTGDEVFATVTGHNFLGRLSLEGGWERVWWPRQVDDLGDDAFNQNYFQLNSMAVGGTPDESFYTGFSNETGGAKPWKQGYGPDGKGVVFSGKTREPLLTGLTCPHAAKIVDGQLWLCNSGYGSIGYVEGYETHDPAQTRYVEVARAPGFTRGLAFAGDHVFVGLSKVIPQYEPYAPGVPAEGSCCGVWVFDKKTGAFVASLEWQDGYQLYDVQVLQGVKQPILPYAARESDGINPYLRFLG